MTRPNTNEYDSYFQSYIDKVKGDNVIKSLQEQILSLQSLITDVSEENENYSYAENKWTIKEVIGHINDTERIMSYRALCIARGETQNLLSFEDDLFVKNGNFSARSIYDLVHEFSQIREASLSLFKSFSTETLNKKGLANSKEISVRALLYICAGHAEHHFRILKTKYLFDL